MNWQMVAFAFLTGALLYSAYRVVTDETITHAALYLAIAFTAVAGFYLLLDAEFLAVIQVLIYSGAVMTVMVFAIMLSPMTEVRGGRLSLRGRLGSAYWGFAPLLVAAGLVILVLLTYARTPLSPDTADLSRRTASVSELAKSLLGPYLVPFEVVSLLLLAAMIGAVVITRVNGDGAGKREGKERDT